MNQKRLKDYANYLKESLDPWKLKQTIKSFNRAPSDLITIPGDLKELSKKLNDELNDITLPYSKLLIFGGIEIEVNIKKSNRYYSNVDWIQFLSGVYQINVEVNNNYDKNYLISTIIHEIRHMIDFTDENLNSGLSSFDIDRNLRKYNIDNFNEFFLLVYISLEHELVARNNQIYPFIKFKNLKKEESIDILKGSFIWEALEKLTKFDSGKFISKFETPILIEITNNFIKDCLYDKETRIENPEELNKFYKVWSDYFSETSKKWKSILLNEVDRIYERKVFNPECAYSYKNIMSDIWKILKQEIKN
jgi:hypothetical protein